MCGFPFWASNHALKSVPWFLLRLFYAKNFVPNPYTDVFTRHKTHTHTHSLLRDPAQVYTRRSEVSQGADSKLGPTTKNIIFCIPQVLTVGGDVVYARLPLCVCETKLNFKRTHFKVVETQSNDHKLIRQP